MPLGFSQWHLNRLHDMELLGRFELPTSSLPKSAGKNYYIFTRASLYHALLYNNVSIPFLCHCVPYNPTLFLQFVGRIVGKTILSQTD